MDDRSEPIGVHKAMKPDDFKKLHIGQVIRHKSSLNLYTVTREFGPGIPLQIEGQSSKRQFSIPLKDSRSYEVVEATA